MSTITAPLTTPLAQTLHVFGMESDDYVRETLIRAAAAIEAIAKAAEALLDAIDGMTDEFQPEAVALRAALAATKEG